MYLLCRQIIDYMTLKQCNLFTCICHKEAILKLTEMKLNAFPSIIIAFFSTSNIRAAVHRTSAEVWTTPYHRTVSSNSWYTGLALEKTTKKWLEYITQNRKKKKEPSMRFPYPSSTKDAFRLLRGAWDKDRVVMTSSRKPTSNLRSSS